MYNSCAKGSPNTEFTKYMCNRGQGRPGTEDRAALLPSPGTELLIVSCPPQGRLSSIPPTHPPPHSTLFPLSKIILPPLFTLDLQNVLVEKQILLRGAGLFMYTETVCPLYREKGKQILLRGAGLFMYTETVCPLYREKGRQRLLNYTNLLLVTRSDSSRQQMLYFQKVFPVFPVFPMTLRPSNI